MASLRLISRFLPSQSGEEAITIHMLLDISQNKNNQKIKFRQLIDFSSKVMQKIRQID